MDDDEWSKPNSRAQSQAKVNNDDTNMLNLFIKLYKPNHQTPTFRWNFTYVVFPNNLWYNAPHWRCGLLFFGGKVPLWPGIFCRGSMGSWRRMSVSGRWGVGLLATGRHGDTTRGTKDGPVRHVVTMALINLGLSLDAKLAVSRRPIR